MTKTIEFGDVIITLEEKGTNGLLLCSSDQAQEFMNEAQIHLDKMPLFHNDNLSPSLLRSVIAETMAHAKSMTLYSDHIVAPEPSKSTLAVQPATWPCEDTLGDDYDDEDDMTYCENCGEESYDELLCEDCYDDEANC